MTIDTMQLFEAIYTLYTDTPVNDFYTATSGRLAYGIGMQGWDNDFAVIQAVDSYPDNFFRDSGFDNVFFQVNLYSNDNVSCWALLSKCRSLITWAKIDVDSHHSYTIRETHVVFPLWNEEDQLYQATVEYTCYLQQA